MVPSGVFASSPPASSAARSCRTSRVVSLERLRGLTHDAIQAPAFAPTVAIEILIPGDDPRDVASKVDVYLRAGCELVISVDSKTRSMTLHDGTTLVLKPGDTLRHRALPGFSLEVGALFDLALDLPV